LLAIAPPAISGHHGAAAYDLQKSVTLEGAVTSFDWNNPHCLLHFDAKNDAGEVKHWRIELYDPLWLARAGWTRTTLKPGDPITITFHTAKDGSSNGYFRDEDGKLTSKGRRLRFHLPGDERIK
jgi:hypothetical protein